MESSVISAELRKAGRLAARHEMVALILTGIRGRSPKRLILKIEGSPLPRFFINVASKGVGFRVDASKRFNSHSESELMSQSLSEIRHGVGKIRHQAKLRPGDRTRDKHPQSRQNA